MTNSFKIGKRGIGSGKPVYVIAEMSGNHNQNFNQAVKIMEAAKYAGANAVKLQTYTPDTMTINSKSGLFTLGNKSLWAKQNLYDLYKKAYTPWEWYPKLKKIADNLHIAIFSTAFDFSAVDFLEKMNVPVHKIASFELIDLPLIEKMVKTGKPLFISTGMGTFAEIKEAVDTAKKAGARKIAIFKTNSAYPAPIEEMNLRSIPDLMDKFHVPVGLSDHTLGIVAPIVAVSLGASFIEKHLTLSRKDPSPDSAFSLEPTEFVEMVQAIRTAEKSLGSIKYGTSSEEESKLYRRSLFTVENIDVGEIFTNKNVRSIRPGYGLSPKYLRDILGKQTKKSIKKGTPLGWDMISK